MQNKPENLPAPISKLELDELKGCTLYIVQGHFGEGKFLEKVYITRPSKMCKTYIHPENVHL